MKQLKIGEFLDISRFNDSKKQILCKNIILRGAQTILRISDNKYKIYYYESFDKVGTYDKLILKFKEYDVHDIHLINENEDK